MIYYGGIKKINSAIIECFHYLVILFLGLLNFSCVNPYQKSLIYIGIQG